MADTALSPEASRPADPAAAHAAPVATVVKPLAGSSLAAWAVLLVVTGVTLWADLWTKSWAFRTVAGRPVEVVRDEVLAIAKVDPLQISRVIPPHSPRIVIDKVLEFFLVVNPGAVFGMGPGQRWFFMTFTFLAVAFALFMFARWCRATDWLAHAAIGMLISGGIGNFYDRMLYGCVRDFIHPVPGIWPYVSNVADAFLLIGIGILALRLWVADDTKAAPAAVKPA